MKKIDRLGWADGISIVAYGVRVGIRVNQPEVLERVREVLPPGWKPAKSPIVDQLYSLRVAAPSRSSRVRNFNLLYAGGSRVGRELELDKLFDQLESKLQIHVAGMAARRVFVHAGVVGWRGQAIVFPGQSFSGKTSLTAAMVRAGATYYSDEYALFDAQGRVHPYPKPLSIREGGGDQQTKYPAEALGGMRGTRPLPVGLIVATHYKPGGHWRPRPLSPYQAALALLAHTVSARARPVNVLATLQPVVACSKALKGARGEADQTARLILKQLET